MSRVSSSMIVEQPRERCCGSSCDQPQRDNELRLLGAREYNRLLQGSLALTDEHKHILNEIETEYNKLLKKRN